MYLLFFSDDVVHGFWSGISLSHDLGLYYHFNFDINKGGVFKEISFFLNQLWQNQCLEKKNLRTFHWKLIIFCFITSTSYFDFLNRLSYFLWESNLFWNCICGWRKKIFPSTTDLHKIQVGIYLKKYI